MQTTHTKPIAKAPTLAPHEQKTHTRRRIFVPDYINLPVPLERFDEFIAKYTHEELKEMKLPDHKQLPCEDGTFVKNFLEHPQSILLTESIWPILQAIHPDEQFTIGQDAGIYWRITTPPERGAVSPDWYYVPNVSPTYEGEPRRSYVMWYEPTPPLIVIEFVSDTEGREYDRTPYRGKFWVYENIVRPAYYAIYIVEEDRVEVYCHVGTQFELMEPNENDRYLIPQMGVELGIWDGSYKNIRVPWLRWWDTDGNPVPTPEERAEQEAQRANRLAARLRELGIDPNEVVS